MSADPWLNRLSDGGRLILSLTISKGFWFDNLYQIQTKGAVFQIERRGEEYLARWISSVAIFPAKEAATTPAKLPSPRRRPTDI
jgi:protein-L-isoaspartate(D-aspartate) O-methyltransferase